MSDVLVPTRGDLVRWPSQDSFVEVRFAELDGDLLRISYKTDGALGEAEISPADLEVAAEDGAAPSAELLAGFWSAWMAAATTNAKSAALASSTLKPYPHQHYAVYGTMLPQPTLRFLLGDEPGTGKTIMGGLFAREAERLGLVNRCLVVCPAHLVTKWQEDFRRFFGGGLERIENSTIKDKTFEFGLKAGQGFWVVSLELAAMNSAVLEALHPDRAGWDLVIVDEAHRMTPSAESYFSVGRILKDAPNFLAMTATPHRGNEFYFRALMHLVDPAIYPMPTRDDESAKVLAPGQIHLLRRMKEELTGYDGEELLFKKRTAANLKVPLSKATEKIVYEEALVLVDTFFPDNARTLGRMVYGKRAASCLHSLKETLQRRHDLMGTKSSIEARLDQDLGDPDGDDEAAADHAAAIFEGSKNARVEKSRLKELVAQIEAHLGDPDPATQSSKWQKLIDQCLTINGITPGNSEQAVVFTEYADTADWLRDKFRHVGFTAERYSGRDSHPVRDEVRDQFMAGKFQIIVSTDAGNEGIDLQSAHVLINWDIPWSLVTLEQRMGRIHRIGQDRDVLLYNIIATDTLEGDTYARLLDRLVSAANEMGGRMFDSLSLIGSKIIDSAGESVTVPLSALFDDPLKAAQARDAIGKISKDMLRQEAELAASANGHLHTAFDKAALAKAVDDIHDGELERINPHIVERFLSRLQGAGLVKVAPSMLAGAEGGLFSLAGTSGFALPKSLKETSPQLVATMGDAKKAVVESGATGASKAVDLGPATAPFRELVRDSLKSLQPSLFRGGVLRDETTVTDYTLFLYETDLKVGTHRITWRHLVRADSDARAVPFEMLANLVAAEGAAASPHPADRHKADEAATAAVQRQRQNKADGLKIWQKEAKRQLARLADKMTQDLPIEERAPARDRIRAATNARIEKLSGVSTVEIAETRLVGWARVKAAGVPEDPTEADSEHIAERHVKDLLEAARWRVDDVSGEKVGYDLKARKGHLMRAVEVKGIWESASSSGVRLTGGEIAKAGLLGSDYWLYVVDQCHDGTGTLYAAYQDPAATFDGLTRDLPIFKIKGSDLKNHQTKANAA